MRAFLGILLTLGVTALVSHPAAAEKRTRQAVVQRSHAPAPPPTATQQPLPAGQREKGCNAPEVLVSGRPC